MNWVDSGRWIFSSVLSYRSRSLLTALGMAVGIVSVTLLTAIGEGVQQYVLDSFSQFGARIIAINPGLKETHGAGGLLSSVRPLTLRDAQALKQLTGVEKVVPVVQGSGVVEFNNLQRSGVIMGVGPDMSDAWDFKVAQGNFFSGNLEDARSTAVLGYTMKKELFGDSNPLGQHIRVGGQRFRVIGTIEKKGQMLGVDMDDTIYIPAQNVTLKRIETRIKDLMIKRHGREDVTLTTQNDMLESMGKILSILKLSVGGLGAISLLVGAVGILAIMTTTVRERTAEVGLLRALGADKKTIMGGLLGLLLLFMLTGLLQLFLPGLPITFNLLFLGLALVMSAVIGLIAGVVPAGQAANLNPINALHEE